MPLKSFAGLQLAASEDPISFLVGFITAYSCCVIVEFAEATTEPID